MPVSAPAVVFTAPGIVEVRAVAVPDPSPDEVRVRTAFSGISQGTERWLLTGRYNHAGDDPASNYPCFPGYQAAGIVECTGEAVTDLRPGDHVMLQGTRFADPRLRNPGPGLASHVGALVAPRKDVTPLSPAVDLAEAALFRMASVGRHGVRLTGVKPDDVVVVIGLGMIGQMSAQAARRRGAHVIAADRVAARCATAAKYSADVVVDVTFDSLADTLRTEAPSGADVVIDTSGSSHIFPTCVELVRHEGRICLQGYYPDPITIDFHPTHQKRPAVTFPCGWDAEDDNQLADDLATGRLAIGPLITHKPSYADAPEAYQLVLERPEACLGMALDWTSHSA